MQLSSLTVSVIGGGLGGLAAATFLGQAGARVTVFEQASGFSEVGAGIQVSNNGLRVLDALRVGPQARQIGFASQGVRLNSQTGQRVALLPNGPRETRLFHRADLLDILKDAAVQAGVDFQFGQRITPDAYPTADVVIAADGVKSSFRPWVTGLDATPKFAGQVAWRAMVPVEKPIKDGGANVYMGPGRHVVVYPIRSGRLLNIVAVEETPDWSTDGWSEPGDPDDLRARFSVFGGPLPALLDRVTDVFKWGLFAHPVARPWARGNVVLLGDAAHPMFPFLAQGVCMGFEDAAALTMSLVAATDPGAAFEAYQAARHPRVSRVVDEARRNATRFHLSNPIARFAAQTGLSVASRLTPGLLFNRYSWLYDFDPMQAQASSVT